MTRSEQILAELERRNGQSDSELAHSILGNRHRAPQINSECRYMRDCGKINRHFRTDGNFLPRPRPSLKVA
jgi:hypothetical protein